MQYDAHAYTTLNECPEPNMKIRFKGNQGYVKLESKGNGDVPCYVKTSDGNTYQVVRQTAPYGQIDLYFDPYGDAYLTIPNGIKVIKAEATPTHAATYIGVTPNITYHLWRHRQIMGEDIYAVTCPSHDIVWQEGYSKRGVYKLSYSPEINKHAITVSDYH